MKFKFNKFTSAIATVGAAVVLTACGGSDEVVVSKDATLSISPASLSQAQAVAAALTTAKATFPITSDLSFPAATAGEAAATAPKGATLSLGAPAAATDIATFTVSSGTESVKGDIQPGSCVFIPRTVSSGFSTQWIVGRRYIQAICTITFPTINTSFNTNLNLFPTFTLGTTNLTSSTSIVVSTNSNGGVTVNNTTVATVPSITGATGSSN